MENFLYSFFFRSPRSLSGRAYGLLRPSRKSRPHLHRQSTAQGKRESKQSLSLFLVVVQVNSIRLLSVGRKAHLFIAKVCSSQSRFNGGILLEPGGPKCLQVVLCFLAHGHISQHLTSHGSCLETSSYENTSFIPKNVKESM